MQKTTRAQKFLKSKTFILLILLAMEVVVFTVLSQGLYVSIINIRNILNSIVITAFLTVGAVLLMVRGYVDISASAVGCFTTMMVAT
ncbi:MAG: hypothetical protein IK082_06535, partial [Oscillospiraceae bacterium]|nr:hypothetical protein [Oscillospiraceae bacterium]